MVQIRPAARTSVSFSLLGDRSVLESGTKSGFRGLIVEEGYVSFELSPCRELFQQLLWDKCCSANQRYERVVLSWSGCSFYSLNKYSQI